MDYSITFLSDELVFIQWLTSPSETSPSNDQFVAELKNCLDSSQQPIYFLSDLRRGRVLRLETARKISHLWSHENFGGGSAFSSDPGKMMVIGYLEKVARHTDQPYQVYESLQEALFFLEELKPGLTQGIDWQKVLDAKS
jgi:hypothetical protein